MPRRPAHVTSRCARSAAATVTSSPSSSTPTPGLSSGDQRVGQHRPLLAGTPARGVHRRSWVSRAGHAGRRQGNRVAAAAHLLRYFSDERAGPAARDVGEIHWLFVLAGGSGRVIPTGRTDKAAEWLIDRVYRQFGDWGVTRQQAGGELPVHGVYGVPDQWPHIRALYQEAGFSHTGHTEIVYLARVEDLTRPARSPSRGCRCAVRPGSTAAACPPCWRT